MKNKEKKYLPTAIGIIVLVAILFATSNLLGVGTIRSAIRVGYVGKEGLRSWKGKYSYFNGWMVRWLRPTGNTLHVDVKTESGSLSIEMKDVDGAVIYSKENLGTASLEVPVSGKTKIKITGNSHKGSFDISESSSE